MLHLVGETIDDERDMLRLATYALNRSITQVQSERPGIAVGAIDPSGRPD